MNAKRLPFRISWLVSALVLSLSFQSCNKEGDNEMPSPTASSQGQNNVATSCKKEVCLVAGQHTYVGTVSTEMSGSNIVVTYNITAPNVYLLEAHVDIFDNLDNFKTAKKLSGGGAIPGKFAFKQSFSSGSHTTTYTATIPKAYINGLNSADACYYIAAHAALSTGDTAWGGLCTDAPKGVTLNGAAQFPGANWSVYFEFCESEGRCSTPADINFTYAWEDLNSAANDADYNDLVVQSRLIKSQSELKIQFTAMARGSAYDHKFRFKVAKTGIVGGMAGIFGASSVTEDANFYYVTVFESTKTALPGLGTNPFANTSPTQTSCTPFAYKEVSLIIDNATFPFNSAKPYEPFITVYTSGTADVNPTYSYDLYVYEVSNRDTWTSYNNEPYPSGILIPKYWRWPFESVSINGRTYGPTVAAPYPDFSLASWYNNLAHPELTFNRTTCGL